MPDPPATALTYLRPSVPTPKIKLMRVLATLLLSVVVCVFPDRANADIYSYVDSAGVTHFTNVPVDDRYAVFIKAPPEPGHESASRTGLARAAYKERVASYAGLIDAAAKRAALQPALLRAVIAVESAFDPRAVSRAGAQGLMQLHPATARRYGVGDAFNAEQNVAGGAHYLSDLLRRFDNNLELALAAYNAGEEAVERHGRHIPPYRETREYVPAVLRLYKQFLEARAT
jgi:soluble lytic murein transglycosylase-like protein